MLEVTDHRVERDIDVLERIVAWRITNPGFAQWWEDNTPDYDDDFVAWIENIRAIAGSNGTSP